MKKLVIILLLAIAGIAASSEFTTASANRMNGKCCMSSDGGRSYRYKVAMRRAARRAAVNVAVAPTCSARAAYCIRISSAKPDRVPMCMEAKAQCLQTGVFVGPYSRQQFAVTQKQ